MICALLFAVPLAAHAYAGTFGRYMGDDFCGAVIFRREGLVGAQKFYYLNWNAVPMTIALLALTDPGGPALAAWLPAAVILAWVASLAWALVPLTKRLYASAHRLLAICLAEGLVFVTTEDAPNIVQSLYLHMPMLAYTIPLVALGAFAGFCLRCADHDQEPGRPTVIFSAVIAFVIGSFGPVYVALQTAAIASALAVTLVLATPSRRARLTPVLVAGLLGSFAALAVIVVAPGNVVRQSRYPTAAGALGLAKQTVLYTMVMFARPLLLLRPFIVSILPSWTPGMHAWVTVVMSMRSSPLMVVLVMVAAPTLAFLAPAGLVARITCRRLLIAIPPMAFAIVAAAMAVGAYGMSAPPPDRALIIPQFAIECLLALWSFLAAVFARGALAARGRLPALSPVAGVALVVLVAVLTTHSTMRTMSLTPSLRVWARTWDEGDGALRAAARRGERHATIITAPLLGGLGWIGHDPRNWANVCVAKYYGLGSVTSR